MWILVGEHLILGFPKTSTHLLPCSQQKAILLQVRALILCILLPGGAYIAWSNPELFECYDGWVMQTALNTTGESSHRAHSATATTITAWTDIFHRYHHVQFEMGCFFRAWGPACRHNLADSGRPLLTRSVCVIVDKAILGFCVLSLDQRHRHHTYNRLPPMLL